MILQVMNWELTLDLNFAFKKYLHTLLFQLFFNESDSPLGKRTIVLTHRGY